MGNFNMRTLFFVFIAIMLVQGLLTWNSEELLDTLLMLPGLVLGLTVHEYAHARTSDKLGDPTPERQGRLTLNPLAHLDPLGTVCLVFAKFGWGKPVQIDPTYYRNPAKDQAKVAAAGPISNFILAFLMFFVGPIGLYAIPNEKISALFYAVFYLGALINLSLGVFNLLPFPPLDGSKIWGYFLKGKAKAIMWEMERYSYIIILILFLTHIPEMIITPVVGTIAGLMDKLISAIFFRLW